MEQNENRVENRRMELLEIEMKTQRKARRRELAAQITLLFLLSLGLVGWLWLIFH